MLTSLFPFLFLHSASFTYLTKLLFLKCIHLEIVSITVCKLGSNSQTLFSKKYIILLYFI